MKNKDTHIAQAAMQQFSKFGLRKTTMQDVADAAGVSRQTLYNAVPNKDALLRLVARHYLTDNVHRCRAALQVQNALTSALDIMITHFVIEPWHTIKSMPEAEEFEGATNAVIADEVADAKRLKTALIRDTLISFSDGQALSSEQADEIASFFYAAAAGIKQDAASEDQLHSLCKTLSQTLQYLINGALR